MNKLPEPLSAIHKGTFAYATIKDRLPVTITKAIDYLSRFRNELINRFGEEASDDIKGCIERLGELRYELSTDKPFRKIIDTAEDAQMWNDALDSLISQVGSENCSWFKGSWLFAECYIYRRIREAMLLSKSDIKQYDPYEHSKIETHEKSKNSIFQLINALCPLNYAEEETNTELIKRRFTVIMEALLWANKNDLSLSSGNDVSSKVHNLIELLDSYKECILTDHMNDVWDHLNSLKEKNSNDKKVHIDIVLDNCSIELASDLILCDFLLRNNFVNQITLHAKAYSWFISDVVKADFEHLLRLISSSNSLVLNNFLKRIKDYMNNSRLVLIHDHPFWTSPYSFNEMEKISPDLYNHFKHNSSLVFLKGDLNYRKLIGDLNWPYDTPLGDAVRSFKPTTLCAIRVLKSDLIASLDTNPMTNERFAIVKKKFKQENDTKWLITGEYGIIQFLKV